MLILIPTLALWIFNFKFLFGQIWKKKVKVVRFCLKAGIHGISRMLIFIPTLVLWISKPKSIFGHIWTEKHQVVQFGWKLAHRVSRRCWFLFRHYFSQFPTLNPFWTSSGRKIQSCSLWLKIVTHGISRMLILILTIVFWMNCQP